MRKGIIAVFFSAAMLLFIPTANAGTVVIDNFSSGSSFIFAFAPGTVNNTLTGGTIRGDDVDITIGPVSGGYTSLLHGTNNLSISMADGTLSPVTLIYDGISNAGLNLDISAEPALELTLSSKDYGDLVVKVTISDGVSATDFKIVTVTGTTGTFIFDFDGSSVDLTDIQTIKVEFTGAVAQDYSFTSFIAHEPTVGVQFASFLATQQNDSVLLEWTAASESGTAGYNILRSTDANGEYDKINAAIIATSDNAVSTKQYSYLDRPIQTGDYFYKIQKVDVQGRTSEHGLVMISYSTGVASNTQNPQSFSLKPNFPNPFNPSTTLRYELATASDVRMEVFDNTGRLLSTLLHEQQNAGIYELQWMGNDANGADAPSGVYFAILTAGDKKYVQKMTLVR
jgi:hypothetical protein